ncbi:glutamate cyclase domain-containing protein [Vineibacter terrae]|uniref:glutamate cyclase domain-containing protein n=1 Tax=Vineibacter terrae TaxID=2586908 RepID=UPI002E321743|nr:glutamate cyclase domain-containing protein [Vineibacter terrae]HEX2890742.1 glutamate cyclase domain-containing protein [Vineibacter terrae]
MQRGDIDARLAAIEAAVCREVGRGAAPLMAATQGQLARSAQALAAAGQPVIGIITGFFVPTLVPPMAETDGPVGAAHLAVGFARSGWRVRLATDSPCAGAMTAAMQGSGEPFGPHIALDVVDADDAPRAIAAVAERWRAAGVTHAIAIERCGRAADGRSYTMRGIDLSATAAPLDDLFTAGAWVRIAIGDGGNEVGMGSLPRDLIARSVPNGEKIACVTPADHLMVCGVSNWGAYALLSALSLLLPAKAASLLATLTPQADLRILETLVRDGPSADPVAGVRAASVDGFAHPVHAAVIEAVLAATRG